MPYPSGVNSYTRNAPWNEPEPPECPECRNNIRYVDDHAETCPCTMDSNELHEFWADERNHVEYDPIEHA